MAATYREYGDCAGIRKACPTLFAGLDAEPSNPYVIVLGDTYAMIAAIVAEMLCELLIRKMPDQHLAMYVANRLPMIAAPYGLLAPIDPELVLAVYRDLVELGFTTETAIERWSAVPFSYGIVLTKVSLNV